METGGGWEDHVGEGEGMIWEYIEAYNLGEIGAEELSAILSASKNVEANEDKCHICKPEIAV
jgi:hypothetical protein